MTQADKQLLLKDLCSRLPYGVKVLADLDKTFDGGCIRIINRIEPYIGNKFPELKGQYLLYEKGCLTPLVVDEVKPYLRPMSSMTDDERKELSLISEEYLDDWSTADSNLLKWKLDAKVSSMRATFYNSHYLDWNGLIPKGLALEAPEGMYKIKEETNEDN